MYKPYLKAVELMNSFSNLFDNDWSKEDARRCALKVVENMKIETDDLNFWRLVEHHLLYI